MLHKKELHLKTNNNFQISFYLLLHFQGLQEFSMQIDNKNKN